MSDTRVDLQIQRLRTAKTNIITSIENKGVTVPSGTKYDGFPTLIDKIPTYIPDVWEGVNFIDYDGTTVEVWPAADVASKTALPSYPTHTGLTYVDWNWTLAALKSYIADYPDACIYVGPEVYPTDGYTHIFIRLIDGALTPYLNFRYYGDNCSIDWGDGSTTSLTNQSSWTLISQQHTYSAPGDYEIIIKCTNLNTYIGASGSSLMSAVQLTSGTSTYPASSILYQSTIRGLWLQNNTRATNIAYTLRDAVNIEFFASRKLTDINGLMLSANMGKYACFPKVGTNQAYAHFRLKAVAVPYDGVPNINWFCNCYSLQAVALPTTTTSIAQTLCYNCRSLRKITIPEGPTSMATQAFYNCPSLEHIVIPSTITAINGANNFYQNYSMRYIIFKPTTPPTVADSTCLQGLPTTCRIIVPMDSYTSYRNGTNYPSASTYTYSIFKTYNSGASLPSSSALFTSITWYATVSDLINETNPITTGNGKEIYGKVVYGAP